MGHSLECMCSKCCPDMFKDGKSIAMTELLRLVEQLDPGRDAIYVRNPHAGLIVCRAHMYELQDYGVEPMGDVLEETMIEVCGFTCQLCTTYESKGRHCENEDCKKPLHPRWPAVYCCNQCALGDM